MKKDTDPEQEQKTIETTCRKNQGKESPDYHTRKITTDQEQPKNNRTIQNPLSKE